MPNLELVHKKDITPFRRLAIGTWRTAYDPSVYGTMHIHMDRATAYIEAFRQKTGVRLTVSHLVARAAAESLKKMPGANALLRFNRVYLRERIGVFRRNQSPPAVGEQFFRVPERGGHDRFAGARGVRQCTTRDLVEVQVRGDEDVGRAYVL